jgi:two-component system, LytTR family, sensor kinase
MSPKNNQYWYVNNKKFTVAVHILVWVIFIVFPHILNKYRLDALGGDAGKGENKSIQLDLLMYIYWISVYYCNSLLLVPGLLLNGRQGYYILVLIPLILATIPLDLATRSLVGLRSTSVAVICYFRFPIFLLDIAAGIAFTVIGTQRKYREKLNEIDKEGLKTELSFLRSQMSPHFIFNVLNNIVSLVRLKSEELEPTVMKLSGLMQYTLYSTEEEKVSLKTETEYLNNYIDLQKQRFSNKTKIEAVFNLCDENVMIEPLLLIPFVENAFKHGAGVINDSTVSISLKTDKDKLFFSVINNFDPSGKLEKDPSSGIGIANVKRRLELLYGEDQKLSIATSGDHFEMGLLIKLKHD